MTSNSTGKKIGKAGLTEALSCGGWTNPVEGLKPHGRRTNWSEGMVEEDKNNVKSKIDAK